MDALEILSIEAEGFRYKRNSALILLEVAKESNDVDDIAMAQALFDRRDAVYEPYRLHRELGSARRAVPLKEAILAELLARDEATTPEGREELRLHRIYAKEQADGAKAAVAELEAAIALNERAASMALVEGDVIVLTSSGNHVVLDDSEKV